MTLNRLLFFCVYLPWITLLVLGPIVLLLKQVSDADRAKKKPLGLYFSLLAAGAFVCAPLAGWFEGILCDVLSLSPDAEPTFASSFLTAFVVAGFVEETLKFVCLSLLAAASRKITKYVRGIAFAAFVSLGFALVENVLYVLSPGHWAGSILVALLRSTTSIPGHFLFGILMGTFFSFAFLNPKTGAAVLGKGAKFGDLSNEEKKRFFKNIALAWLVAVAAHGLYDFFLFFGAVRSPLQGLSVVAFLFYLIALCWGGKQIVEKLKERDAAIRDAKQRESPGFGKYDYRIRR